jgi:hypothetical protein
MSVQCRCVQGRRQTQNVECRVQNAKRSGMGHRPADDGPARPHRAGQHRKRRHACAARGCSGRFETPDLLRPISNAFQPLRFPGAAYRTRVERTSPVTLHSALCILHSAFCTPQFCTPQFCPSLVRAPAGAHRTWDPGGAFSVRAPGSAHQGALAVRGRERSCSTPARRERLGWATSERIILRSVRAASRG